jgi:hypothetical protein
MTDVLRSHGFDARSVAGGTNAWSRPSRQFGDHWALISQREVTQNNPIPVESFPSQAGCQRVEPSKTVVHMPYHPTPAGIIGTATGTGSNPLAE